MHDTNRGRDMNFEDLDYSVLEWADKNGILKANDHKAQAMKFGEEAGELFGALLRKDQKKIVDSLGDVVVTLIILAEMHGLDLTECVEAAYNEIAGRKGEMRDGAFVKEEESSDAKPPDAWARGISITVEGDRIDDMIDKIHAARKLEPTLTEITGLSSGEVINLIWEISNRRRKG
jgi:NTP pyrophosphatase (non-canonical NTP hydrolase)